MLPPVGSGRLLVHLASLTKLAPLGHFGFRFLQLTLLSTCLKVLSLMVVERLG